MMARQRDKTTMATSPNRGNRNTHDLTRQRYRTVRLEIVLSRHAATMTPSRNENVAGA